MAMRHPRIQNHNLIERKEVTTMRMGMRCVCLSKIEKGDGG